MKHVKNVITAMIIAVMVVIQFIYHYDRVSADDGGEVGKPSNVTITSPMEEPETIDSQNGTEDSEPAYPLDPESDLSGLTQVLSEGNGELTNGSGVSIPMASQETRNILSGDPYFADPSDPSVARVFLVSCSGWVLPAGFTSGTCTETPIPVQTAIKAAVSGTTIFIEAGAYSEDVSISTANLTLVGLGGNAVIDQLRLYADVNDLSLNVYSPLVHVYRNGNLVDASHLVLPGGKIKIHSNEKKSGKSPGPSVPVLPNDGNEIIPVTGGETVNFSCVTPTELVLPSGATTASTNILCGYSGTFSSIGLDNLPGVLDGKYTFINGVSLVLRDKGKPALVLPGPSKLVISIPIPNLSATGNLVVLEWDQDLYNGAGAWVVMNGIENRNGNIVFSASYPGIFVVVQQ